MMHLSGLYRYPLKSAQGEVLGSAYVDALGVQGDRRWMLVDQSTGRFLSQRLLTQMTQLQALWQGHDYLRLNVPGQPELLVPLPDANSALRTVTIWKDTLDVPDAGDAAAQWLSNWLGRPCRLVHVPAARARQVDTDYAQAGDKVAFADGFPLLLIGQASLDDLSARIGRPQSMLQFRPNLVVAGGEPYAEDSWRHIRIGTVEFRVAKGCGRCIMTTVNPQTGERSADREPLTTLRTYRHGEDGQIYFGQNLIACGAGQLDLSMPVEVLE